VSVKARFDALYADRPDPWGFESSVYEHAKYDATVAALPRRYATALEAGCSIGVLSERLAARCDALLGVDVAEAPLARARERVPQATFERRELPAEFPAGPFELIVYSEVLYYVDALEALLDATERELAPGGTLVAVHWLGEAATPDIHARLADRFGAPSHKAWTNDYALDRWEVPA
jgi:predicted TPR repeat methyltransferase